MLCRDLIVLKVSTVSRNTFFKSPHRVCFVWIVNVLVSSLPRLEQRIQKVLSEEEAKWKLLFSELHLKVDKSRELYDFCVDLLRSGGIRFSEEVMAHSIHSITPSKPQKQE